MSATINVDKFSQYFDDAPVIFIEGRQHPVDVMYLDPTQEETDFVHNTLVAVFQIHRTAPQSEGILAFLPGSDDIEACVRLCREVKQKVHTTSHSTSTSSNFQALPLYAALHAEEQLRIFEPMHSMRKIVFATNIAETSITIPGIRHVIDCGRVKMKLYEPSRSLLMLRVVPISKSAATQRAGRAGREAPGSVYRLYSQEMYGRMEDDTTPEIQRSSLAAVALELLAMKITDISSFPFLDRPSQKSLEDSLTVLEHLGAISVGDRGTCQMTPIGHKMVKFPLDPRLSRILVSANRLGCLDQAIAMVASMSTDSTVMRQISPTADNRSRVLQARAKFTSEHGDHLTEYRILTHFQRLSQHEARRWCFEHNFDYHHLTAAVAIRTDLVKICQQLNMNLSSQSTGERPDILLRRALCAGLFLTSAAFTEYGSGSGNFTTLSRHPNRVRIHPSSVLQVRGGEGDCVFIIHVHALPLEYGAWCGQNPQYVVYSDLMYTSACYIRTVTRVEPEWLSEASPSFFKDKNLVLNS